MLFKIWWRRATIFFSVRFPAPSLAIKQRITAELRSRRTESLISLHHVLLHSLELAFFIVRNPDAFVLLIVLVILHLLVPHWR